MNEKIPLKRFATAVAEKSGIDAAEAEAFIKALFKLVADELRTGQSVHVGGLGEFRLTNNPADPVVFVPDAAWADAVNAPFAMFEPVELADDITEQELAAAAEEIAQPEPEEPQPEPEEHQPEAAEPQPEPQPELVAEPVTEPAVAVEPVAAEEMVVVEETPAAEEIADVEETPQPEVTPPEAQAEPEPQKPAYRWPEEEEAEAETETPVEEAIPAEEVATAAAASGSFSRGFIVGLIVGLAIGALALCAYVLYYVNTPAGELPLSTELEATEIFPAN